MNNLEKYNQAFLDTFDINIENLESLEYKKDDCWDSVGHMGVIAAIEDTFSVSLETEDIIDFSSYKKGIEILKKYGINM